MTNLDAELKGKLFNMWNNIEWNNLLFNNDFLLNAHHTGHKVFISSNI